MKLLFLKHLVRYNTVISGSGSEFIVVAGKESFQKQHTELVLR